VVVKICCRNIWIIAPFIIIFTDILGVDCILSPILRERDLRDVKFSLPEMRVNTFTVSKYRKPETILNLLKTKRNLLYIRNQSVPRSKLFPPQL
jgi:hypothetical protein